LVYSELLHSTLQGTILTSTVNIEASLNYIVVNNAPHDPLTPAKPAPTHDIVEKSPPSSTPLHRPRNTQIPNLLQHLLDPRIQLTLRILVPRIRIQILLHLRHATIRLGAEP